MLLNYSTTWQVLLPIVKIYRLCVAQETPKIEFKKTEQILKDNIVIK